MVGLKVGLALVFMAVATLFGNDQPEVLFMDLGNGVVGVAVDADRQLLVGLGDQGAMHGFVELIDNPDMALVAGVDDVVTVDA